MRFSTIVLLCSACASALAQSPRDQRTEPPPALSLVVLQGQGAIHNINSGEVTEPVVEVRDEFGKPVAGAEVVFALPAKGAGGVFQDGETSLTVKSNPQGQAGGLGFKPNRVEGEFLVAVTARQGDRAGRTVIRQTNSLQRSSSGVRKRDGSTVWKVVLAVGGLAVSGGIFALTRSGGSSSGGPAATTGGFTVTPGPVSVSPPR